MPLAAQKGKREILEKEHEKTEKGKKAFARKKSHKTNFGAHMTIQKYNKTFGICDILEVEPPVSFLPTNINQGSGVFVLVFS